jgi:hypothetical protein
MFIWPTPKPALLAAITVLDEAFGDYAFVSAKLPGTIRPERFVRVTRTGGNSANIATDDARILVEVYSKDVGEAEAMVSMATAALRNAGGTTITSGDYRMFIRRWKEDSIAVPFDNPEILDYERGQVTGTLMVKAN